MKILRKNGATSNVLRVKILDTAQGNSAGKTGLAANSGGLVTTAGLIISTVCDNEATATVYAVAASHIQTVATLGAFVAPSSNCCRFAEVDSTNHPGVYEVQLPDARFAVAGAKSLIVTISGASGAAQSDAEVQLNSLDLDTASSAQSGDSYARIGANGAGLTAVALVSTGLNAVLVDGVELPTAFEYIAASTAGKLSGAGTNTEVFVGLDGATTRLTATVDASGNRAAITYG